MDFREVYVAGKITDSSNARKIGWRLIGIYTTEDAAVEACTSKRDFVRCFDLNKTLEQQGSTLKNIRFPVKKAKSL